jgi:hypothetical protein
MDPGSAPQHYVLRCGWGTRHDNVSNNRRIKRVRGSIEEM